MTGAPPPERPLRFLLFDLDGTLVETLADIAASVNFALGALGVPERSDEEIRSFVGRGIPVLIERALGAKRKDLAGETLRIFRAHYDEHCLDRSALMPGARQCLETFAGRRLAVVSNKPEKYVRRIAERLGIAPFFESLFGGDSVGEKKPSPEMIFAALHRFGLGPREGILVGDHPVDVETGRAAGVYTVAILGGFGRREEVEAAGPDRIAGSLHEVARDFA